MFFSRSSLTHTKLHQTNVQDEIDAYRKYLWGLVLIWQTTNVQDKIDATRKYLWGLVLIWQTTNDQDDIEANRKYLWVAG